MCDCLTKIQDNLKAKGLEIPTSLPLRGGPAIPFFPLYRADTGKLETRRGRPKYVMPTHCPFCGAEYAQEGSSHDA